MSLLAVPALWHCYCITDASPASGLQPCVSCSDGTITYHRRDYPVSQTALWSLSSLCSSVCVCVCAAVPLTSFVHIRLFCIRDLCSVLCVGRRRSASALPGWTHRQKRASLCGNTVSDQQAHNRADQETGAERAAKRHPSARTLWENSLMLKRWERMRSWSSGWGMSRVPPARSLKLLCACTYYSLAYLAQIIDILKQKPVVQL